MRIINISKGTVLAAECMQADSFIKRFRGLMLKPCLPEGRGLLIKPCSSIHMFFMRFPIDVLFLDKNNMVVYTISNIKPWRISPLIRNAKSVVELPAGTLQKSRTEAGDMISMI